jgi:hypothetical protein
MHILHKVHNLSLRTAQKRFRGAVDSMLDQQAEGLWVNDPIRIKIASINGHPLEKHIQ